MATYSRSKGLMKSKSETWKLSRKCKYNENPVRAKVRWFPPRLYWGFGGIQATRMKSWVHVIIVETSPTNTSQNPHQWP